MSLNPDVVEPTKDYVDVFKEANKEIPDYYKDFVNHYGSRVFNLALQFGYIIPGFTLKDYLLYAVDEKNSSGYETINIWGSQGSKKSDRTLIFSHWCYGENQEDYAAWDTVLKNIVLLPDAHDLPGYEDRGLLQKFKAINRDEVAPVVAWDDVTVSFASGSFKTDPELYQAIDSVWAAIRTKVRVMILNNPLIDRLSKVLKDNITVEVYLGRNQMELKERFFRLPGLNRIESNFYKIQMEPIYRFDWKYCPSDVFGEYFELRKEIADYAIHKLGKSMGDEAELIKEMIPMDEMWKDSPVSLTTLNDMLKRNFIENEKINGKKYVKRAKWEEFKAYMVANQKSTKKQH